MSISYFTIATEIRFIQLNKNKGQQGKDQTAAPVTQPKKLAGIPSGLSSVQGGGGGAGGGKGNQKTDKAGSTASSTPQQSED